MHALAAASSSGSGAADIILGVLISVLAFAAYWAPAAVAWIRRVPNAGSVTVINGFLGWTVIGWIIALAMACRSHPRTPPVPAAGS